MHTLITIAVRVPETRGDDYGQQEFELDIRNKVEELLEGYCFNTEDMKYLEFEDKTEEIKAQYEKDCVDCIRLPEGKIIECAQIGNRFTVKDGKVYQCYTSSAFKLKRTKRAKRMKALPNYPVKKLYRNIADYAYNCYKYTYDKQYNAYGFYYNPNAFYDYYKIGGRWSELFLVKDSCKEYVSGWTSFDSHKTFDVPAGYRWVCAARKCDIEWTLMRKYFIQQEKDSIETGYSDESIRYKSYKYLVDIFGFLEDGILVEQDNGIWEDDSWEQAVDSYISRLEDDAVIVGIDYHW